jgi:hypothetical protein
MAGMNLEWEDMGPLLTHIPDLFDEDNEIPHNLPLVLSFYLQSYINTCREKVCKVTWVDFKYKNPVFLCKGFY